MGHYLSEMESEAEWLERKAMLDEIRARRAAGWEPRSETDDYYACPRCFAVVAGEDWQAHGHWHEEAE